MIPDLITRDQRIANYAKSCPSAATSHVVLAECDYCGWLDWVCSSPANPPSVSVNRMGHDRCPVCMSVRMRNPEVFNWVLSVLAKHEEGAGHVA